MKSDDKPAIGTGTVVGFFLLNAITGLMAWAWLSIFSLTSALGKSLPSPLQYLEMFWPALVGLALAAISLFLAFKLSRRMGFLVAIVGIAVMPIAFSVMMP